MSLRCNATISVLCAFLGALVTAQAASFVRDVAPVLAAKCVTCHNKEKSKGGYEMETFEALMRPGDSEERPIVPHHPEKSHLVELLRTKDEDNRMPQKSEPLAAGQIGLIEEWIREGARIDASQRKVPLQTLIATAHPAPPESYSRAVPIRALAFSPDGTELAVGGYHEVTFWRTEDGKLLRRISNVAQQVYGIAYAPSGKLVAVASGTPGKLGQINVFDPMGTDAGRVLGTARDAMLAVCFGSGGGGSTGTNCPRSEGAGARLAAGGADNAIRIYEVETGQQELLIEQHADWVLGLSFNNDSSLLASASRDKTARVFNTTNGELESTYVGHNDAVFAVAFVTDGKDGQDARPTAEGKRLCSAGRDKTLHLWDAKEGKKSDEAKGFEGEVVRLVAGSNSVFTCGADRKIRRYSVAKKLELVGTFSGHEDTIYGLALHEPGGKGSREPASPRFGPRLASGSFDGEVRVWDIESGKTLVSFIAAPGWKALKR